MTKKEMQAHIIELERRVNNLDTWLSQNRTTPSEDIYIPLTVVPAPPQEAPSPIIQIQ